MPSVLIIDDEPEILDTTRWAFELAGYEVHTAASGEEALPQARQVRPQVMLIDYKLPRMNGLELLRAVRTWIPNVVAIMITGLTHQTERLEEESRRLGAVGFLHKPLEMGKLIEMVRQDERARDTPGERKERFDDAAAGGGR